jgi:broad specificity phosphatase PhoE
VLLLLARHGATALTGKRLSGWLPGIHLSDEGRRQAERLAERLAPFPLEIGRAHV